MSTRSERASFPVQVGPRGGRFYVNAAGRKVYVSRGTKGSVRAPKTPAPVIGSKTARGATHVAAWSPKRNREYERVLESELARGRAEKDARRIAAATVNKIRSEHNETRS
jgi:hypothetical protein